jgi:hydrogenase nickel incorporation protein HypA/HybF
VQGGHHERESTRETGLTSILGRHRAARLPGPDRQNIPDMHELGIAESALQVALKRARDEGATRVRRIVIRVGTLSGVDPEALRFALTTILPGTAAEEAVLQIDPVPALAYCQDCLQDFTPDTDHFFECPKCGRLCGTIKQGRELDLVRLEVI